MPKEGKFHSTSYGGADKKMSKYPRIIDYIEAHHDDVFKVIEDLSAQNILTPRRGGGITFLVPDSAYVKEIRKQFYGNDPEVATDMLYSLVIPVLLKDSKDWDSMKDDIPNLLNKKIGVSSVSASKIVLDNKAEVSPSKFVPFSRMGTSKRDNMAVWNLKGKVEYEKAPTAALKYLRQKPTKTGGNEAGSAEDDNKINAFVAHIETQEKAAFASKKAGEPLESVKASVLCNYLKKLSDRADDHDHKAYFAGLYDHGSAGSIESAFYLVFCCREFGPRQGIHSTKLLSELIGDNAANSPLANPVSKPISTLASLCPKSGGNEDAEIIIDGLSLAIRSKTSTDIKSAYETYVSTKMDSGPLKTTYQRLGYMFKLLVDEFKFACRRSWKSWVECAVEKSGRELIGDYSQFLTTIRDMYGSYSGVSINNPGSQGVITKMSSVETDDKIYICSFLSEGMWKEAAIRGGEDDSEDSEDSEDDSKKDEKPYNDEEVKELTDVCKGQIANFIESKGLDTDKVCVADLLKM